MFDVRIGRRSFEYKGFGPSNKDRWMFDARIGRRSFWYKGSGCPRRTDSFLLYKKDVENPTSQGLLTKKYINMKLIMSVIMALVSTSVGWTAMCNAGTEGDNTCEKKYGLHTYCVSRLLIESCRILA